MALIVHILSATVFENTCPPGADIANVDRAVSPASGKSNGNRQPNRSGTAGAISAAGHIWLRRRSSYLGDLEA